MKPGPHSRQRAVLMTLAGLLAALLGARPVNAEHFEVSLRLTGASGRAEAGWDTDPPEGGLNPRQRLLARAGEELLLEWRMRSEFPHGVMKDVTIRLLVAPQRETGQKEVPPADTPRVLDNSFTADFLPDHSAKGHVRFRAPAPGTYLVRLQSEHTLFEHGHEHFGAVDLVVQ